ncbi:MAG TPA: glycosyltransferase family A protein [Verrucomicrobiae bacterium]|jgi:glycosyltransferase involved in cell wall biosynthesis|nr:glycosyltransferase family A protein [Verrucomicrobiae bacterium]
MKVSVLIPTYNYGRYLAEAVESVLSQDFTDFELLIMDDCSTDDTATVARRYAARDARVRFAVQTQNVGMVENWNHCLREARGEHVKFLFGDDRLCSPSALRKLVALLEQNPSATLAASARVIFDENSRPVDLYRDLPDGLHEGRSVIASILRQGGKNIVGEPSVVLFRKRDASRGFDPQYKQVVDVEMWFHLLQNGRLAYTTEALCGFRVHSLQATERNFVSGVAWREYVQYFSSYALQPWMPRDAICAILFRVRRLRSAEPSAAAWVERLQQRLGPGWRWAYAWHVLKYRLAKPFHNLRHSLAKRRFRAANATSFS